ncbi:hypothetical protein H4R99_007024, partial [Coemansia sp. RSA 1722]
CRRWAFGSMSSSRSMLLRWIWLLMRSPKRSAPGPKLLLRKLTSHSKNSSGQLHRLAGHAQTPPLN